MAKSIMEQFKSKLYRVRHITDIRDMILQSGRIYKKRNAFMLKDSGGNIYPVTYEKFCSDYISLVTLLLSKKVERSTKIAVIGANSYQWSLSYVAAVTAGVVVPIDKELAEEDIVNFINAAECKFVFADGIILDKITPLLSGKEITFISIQEHAGKYPYIFNLVKEGEGLRQKGDKSFENIKIDPYAMSILLFTSGTTGSSKGVCLSQHNICINIMQVSKMVKVKSSEHVLSILPLHHTYECTLGFLLIIYSGGCISYTDGIRHIAKNFNEYHISVVIAVPLLLEHMLKRISSSVIKELPAKYKPKDEDIDFLELYKSLPFYVRLVVKAKVKNSLGGRLHLMIVGAAAPSPKTIETLDALGFRTLQGYGLTECSPLIVGNNDFFVKYDSAGLPIPGVDIKIVDKDEGGVGEIIARGENIMLGYFNDEEATAAVLKDGWFYTGDLGYQDENGFVYITGRKKNVIVTSGGKNIYPEEIEYWLNREKLITEALIVGENSYDDVLVKAKIFPNIDAIKAQLSVSIPTTEEINEAINQAVARINSRLPSYKRIKKIVIRDKDFERTTTNKVKRYGKNVEDDE